MNQRRILLGVVIQKNKKQNKTIAVKYLRIVYRYGCNLKSVFSTISVCNFDFIADKMLAQMVTLWKQEVQAKPILSTKCYVVKI